MAGSLRAVITGAAGRGTSFVDEFKDYRIVLPPLPTREELKRTVVLHCDPDGRPYRIEDFRQPVNEAGVIEQVGGIGAYQMSHVWLVKFRSEEAKRKLLDAGHITVKGKTCVIFDLERHELRLKVHRWCAFNVSNETLRRPLAEYGEVKEVSSDRWKTDAYREWDTVPGRAPIILRCRNAGHIGRDCMVPKCSQCYAYRHEEVERMKSYARAAGRRTLGENSELHTDEDEAELAASSPVVETLTAALKRNEEDNNTPPTAEPTLSPPESAVTNKVTEKPQDAPSPA
ncbi:hypothetical protein V5799_025544 [Amblyomma americanum]|uniref:CCHC-type domain-containing protein n=1 Tax=Amblyomma americanum TaxID=6943 RepID=A0AAQ4E8Z5_AMBAM